MATPTNRANREARLGRRGVATTTRGLTRRVPRAHTHSAQTRRIEQARLQAKAASLTTRLTTSTNIALAGLQLVIGYQWLVSGVDKILLGAFPTQIGQLLTLQIGSGKLPPYFAAVLEALVVPNASIFGYAIMLSETLAGLGLIAAGTATLLRPLFEAHTHGRLWKAFAVTDRLVMMLAPVAAAGAALLGLSYYLLDGAPTLWFTPSLAYGGAIAPGMVVALASLVLVIAQVSNMRTGR
jgi:hypothetical protein